MLARTNLKFLARSHRDIPNMMRGHNHISSCWKSLHWQGKRFFYGQTCTNINYVNEKYNNECLTIHKRGHLRYTIVHVLKPATIPGSRSTQLRSLRSVVMLIEVHWDGADKNRNVVFLKCSFVFAVELAEQISFHSNQRQGNIMNDEHDKPCCKTTSC